MSAFRDPVGPQPKRVYWRRRALVILGALAVIAAIILIVVRPSFSSSGAAPAQTPSAEQQQQASESSAEPAVCSADQVVVTAVTDATEYPADVEPQLSWTAQNTGASPCVLDVGTAHQVFTITSGDEVIWRSTDCQVEKSDYPFTLEPAGEPASSANIAWARERSTPDTCGDGVEREKVPGEGASYHLEVTVGGIDSEDTKQFLLY